MKWFNSKFVPKLQSPHDQARKAFKIYRKWEYFTRARSIVDVGVER
jgi:hypothetical protein